MRIYITDKKRYQAYPKEHEPMWVKSARKYFTDGGYYAKPYKDGYLMFDEEKDTLKQELLKENPNLEIIAE